jgi:phosphatidylserine/phosphatidylglycerophosphate/cardiolipin synthase-like enzyme
MNSIQDNETSRKSVRILLSSPVFEGKNGGWQDGARAFDFKSRIGFLAKQPEANLHKWFDARCKIRRVAARGERFNHCKVTSVDGKLLYVGSDNAYPNYNEEHGIWIDDEAAITAWRTDNFEKRWSDAWSVAADLTATAPVN